MGNAMRNLLMTGLVTAGLLFAGANGALAQDRKPLLMDGKTTLYQKVLTRPGAVLRDKPDAAAGTDLVPMSVLYVYGRENGRVEVGASAGGKVQGFIDETATIPWEHSLVMSFANPTGRDRVLFFKDRTGLMDTLSAENAAKMVEPIRAEIAQGTMPDNSPVISIEPENTVDLQQKFYLLPILEAKQAVLPSGFRVRTVRVASVSAEEEEQLNQRVNPVDALKDFRSGVVFVVDASSSMQPYIDRTRQAVAEVFDRVENAKLNDKVRFGLVAYRDDPKAVKGMEYLAKTFADPNNVATRDDFLKAAEGVKATEQSTRAFAEDAYAGLEHTLRGINWDDFGGRFVVLITDASAREGNSALSTTNLSTDQVRQLAQDTGAAIYVLHQLTPEGAKDHATAKTQYERLSAYPGLGSLYFPVEAGNPEAFKARVTQLADLLVDQVRRAAEPDAKPAAAADADDKLAAATEEVGLAMRLAYLGKIEGTSVPPMFEAWTSDRDFARPEIASLNVRVLLTKNQLSDLQTTLRNVVAAGEKSQITPDDFFNQLRSAAVTMGRDPSRVGQGDVRNLEQSGLMGEYLDGLPYQSQLMKLDEDTWTRLGIGEQQAVIDDIKSKIALYQRFHDDVDRWVLLAEGAQAGDAVYPVPIDSLP